MRILYVIESISTPGGVERILIDKMNALCAVPGYEITLLTVWKETREAAFTIDKRIKHLSLDVTLPQLPMGLALMLPLVWLRYKRKLKEVAPDVAVHFRAMGAFLLGYTHHSCKTVFESHGVRYSNNHLWLYPRMERKVDTVVCLTHGDANEYSTPKRIKVIPNFSQLKPIAEPNYERKHCLFVGRLCFEKNPIRLIELWQKIHAQKNDWILDIYGDGDLHQEVVKSIAQMHLQDSVVMHGHCADVAQAFAQGSILLFTSRSEGFGLSILEAMICQLPVVSFDIKCGPSDLIENEKTGFLIPENNDELFVEQVTRLMNDVSLRKQMGEAASISAKRFDKETIMQQWQTLFENV